MKFHSSYLVMAMLSLATFFACKKPSPKDITGKEYTSAYVCPMHCKESGSDTTGLCPVCGMDYVPHHEHTSDGHKH
ncbi:MAG: hypothetical protein IPN60_09930 [Saprospiraceae bacterium]|nr:hypothetical protein [Candidatus Opimibacter skivensis]HQW25794.1 heavy metal-binding domain-containing protein [Saprospiraceae bacterium]